MSSTPPAVNRTRVAVICGGVGAARMLSGIVAVPDLVAASDVTGIVNVGDDLELHGLRISPDLDTITYTLAGEINSETGWGLRGESWQAMETVKRLGGMSWFGLGDRDLGTHLYRTQRVAEGAGLAQITAEVTAGWGVAVRLLPVTEDRLRTVLTLGGDGPDADQQVAFQEYFVHRRHAVPVRSVSFEGAVDARPGPGVMDALAEAERIVIAPSNPVISIDPVLAVAGVRQALERRRADTVAVSPIVDGAALKGPADRLLTELGHDATVVGITRLYAPLAATLVIDEADAHLADEVAAAGMRPVVTATVMRTPEIAAALARTVLA